MMSDKETTEPRDLPPFILQSFPESINSHWYMDLVKIHDYIITNILNIHYCFGACKHQGNIHVILPFKILFYCFIEDERKPIMISSIYI